VHLFLHLRGGMEYVPSLRSIDSSRANIEIMDAEDDY
jgi:hypothetical protein